MSWWFQPRPGIRCGRRLVFEQFCTGVISAGALGSGLGLAIVKQVGLNHGGLLRIRHRPRQPAPGTSIYVLPASDADSIASRCDGWRSELDIENSQGSANVILSGISVRAQPSCAVTVESHTLASHAGQVGQ